MTAARSSSVRPSTMNEGAYGWPMVSSRSRKRSRSSAISMASMGVPNRRVPVRSRTPARATSMARFSPVWPPMPARMPSGFSISRMRSTEATVSGSR